MLLSILPLNVFHVNIKVQIEVKESKDPPHSWSWHGFSPRSSQHAWKRGTSFIDSRMRRWDRVEQDLSNRRHADSNTRITLGMSSKKKHRWKIMTINIPWLSHTQPHHYSTQLMRFSWSIGRWLSRIEKKNVSGERLLRRDNKSGCLEKWLLQVGTYSCVVHHATSRLGTREAMQINLDDLHAICE